MNAYIVWVNLAEGATDLELTAAVRDYLNWLKNEGLLIQWRLQRRKLGFGPSELGEFQVTMEFESLSQMELCHERVAVRSGELEELHRAVYSRVKDYRSGLYRDFPDSVRNLGS